MFTAGYELPFRFGSQTAQHVLGGWQVNASAFWQSGLPFDVTNQNAAVNGGGTDRPNLVGDPNLPKSERTVGDFMQPPSSGRRRSLRETRPGT